MTVVVQNSLNEISPPPGATGSVKAKEVLRCWIVDDDLRVSFLPNAFVDSIETWGLLLSDVARHIAQSAEQDGIASYDVARSRIKKQFDAEWNKPSGIAKTTTAPKG